MSLKTRLPTIAAELRPKVSAAIKAGADGVSRDAKERVHVRRGDLREAIHVERTGPAQYTVVAGDGEVFYGHLEEHGTVHSPPHPFLVPALESERDHIVSGVAAVLKVL